MAISVEHGHSHGHAHVHVQGQGHAAPAAATSPLARGLGFRLGWALGLSALLWLGVAWALQ